MYEYIRNYLNLTISLDWEKEFSDFDVCAVSQSWTTRHEEMFSVNKVGLEVKLIKSEIKNHYDVYSQTKEYEIILSCILDSHDIYSTFIAL